MKYKTELPAIQSLWIGDSLSIIEQLCIKSYIHHGHEFHLYTYQSIDNIPEGTIIKDATEIIPREDIFTVSSGWGKGSYTAFANLFRYKLLLDRGGWWVDTDIICIKPIDITEELVIATSYEGKWGVCANNCVLRSLPGNKLMERLYQHVNTMDKSDIKFGQTGVHLIQGMVKELQLEEALVPYYFFNPFSYKDVSTKILGNYSGLKELIKEKLRPILKPKTMGGKFIHKDSFTIHLWNEVWRQNGWDKNKTYSSSSLLEKLKKKYHAK